MDHKQFFLFDALGVIAWTFLVTLTGYFVGSRIPGIENYIEPVLILVVLAVLLPAIFHAFRDEKVRAAFKNRFKR
jgi:membrane-associated protein